MKACGIVAFVAVLLVIAVLVVARARRLRKPMPRALCLSLERGLLPTAEQQVQIKACLQVLLDQVQYTCKNPDEDELPRLEPWICYGAPNAIAPVIRLELVDYFDTEIGALIPTIERTKARIAEILGVEPADIVFVLDPGPKGTPAPPGPCLNGGGRSPF